NFPKCFIGEIKERRLRCDIEKWLGFRRVHDALRSGLSASPVRDQTYETEKSRRRGPRGSLRKFFPSMHRHELSDAHRIATSASIGRALSLALKCVSSARAVRRQESQRAIRMLRRSRRSFVFEFAETAAATRSTTCRAQR